MNLYSLDAWELKEHAREFEKRRDHRAAILRQACTITNKTERRRFLTDRGFSVITYEDKK